jgi:hypothetical protein
MAGTVMIAAAGATPDSLIISSRRPWPPDAPRSPTRCARVAEKPDFMPIPNDVAAWVNRHFREIDRTTAIGLLEDAVDEWDDPVEPRLLRCAVIGSRGDLDRLTELVEELRIDSEDVILSGEYESRGGDLIKVRDLNEPLEDV